MKRIVLAILLVVSCLLLSSCNYTVFDTTWSFNRAIISMPDGTVVDGKVQSWKDFEDGDQIQVRINDVSYLVHSCDIVLIAE